MFRSMVRFFMYSLIFGIINNTIAQNPTWLVENFDGVTPCFLSWSPAGAFQGSAGHDISKMTWDPTLGDGALELHVKTHPTTHGPLYYTLSDGDDLACNAAAGLVDVSEKYSNFQIRIKATEPMKINLYLQEGNAASWDYSRASATPLVLNLTTSYQCFNLDQIDTTSFTGAKAIDLSSIGAVLFELGKSDGVNYDQVEGKIIVDYIKFNYFSCIASSDEKAILPLNVKPNPSTGIFTIDVNPTLETNITITNINGSVVKSLNTFGTDSYRFSLGLPKGVYFIRTESNIEVRSSKLIIE